VLFSGTANPHQRFNYYRLKAGLIVRP
jgi:hypothetical protein